MTKGYRSKWTHLLGYKRFLSQMNPCSISETCSSPPPPLIPCFKEVFDPKGGGRRGGKTWSYQNNLPQRNVALMTQNFFNKCDSGWGLSSLFFLSSSLPRTGKVAVMRQKLVNCLRRICHYYVILLLKIKQYFGWPVFAQCVTWKWLAPKEIL